MNSLSRDELNTLWAVACRCRLDRHRDALLGDLALHVATHPVPRNQLLKDLLHLNRLAALGEPHFAGWLRRASALAEPSNPQLRQALARISPSSVGRLQGVQVVLLGLDGARRSAVRRLLAHQGLDASLVLERLRRSGFAVLADGLGARKALALAAHFDQLGAAIGFTPPTGEAPFIRRRPYEGVVVAQLPASHQWLQIQPADAWLLRRVLGTAPADAALTIDECRAAVARIGSRFGLGCVVRLPTREEWDFTMSAEAKSTGANQYGLYGEPVTREWLAGSSPSGALERRRFRLLVETHQPS